MDSIYSRKKIKFPRVEGFHTGHKNAKKLFSIFIVMIVATITFYSIFRLVNPIFENLCLKEARQVATYIVNNSANKVLNNSDYSDIVTIEENGKSKILKTDVSVINKIATGIALDAGNEFRKLEKENIKIPLGALTGNKFLAAAGPNINIKIISSGNILTQIKNEFESKGINQTIYRIYLEIICKTDIVTQYKKMEENTVTQVLLVETVVVGEVPESYYNLEGLDSKDSLQIIK